MIRKLSLSVLLAITFSLPIAVGQEIKSPPKTDTPAAKHKPSDESLQDLGKVVQNYIDKNHAIGAELLVIHRGQALYHESFGFSDREDKRPWENDTLCNIRSMTKPITSAAAQILIDRNLLELDEPVAKYLESFNEDEDSKRITVRQVLTHRSGLPLTNVLNPYQYSRRVSEGGARC